MYKQNYKCFCCNSENLSDILNLGKQPLANSYVQNLGQQEDSFPLELVFCNDCTHLQLKHTVNPKLLFKEYLYVSGTSNTLREYFKTFVELTEKYVKNGTTVLDIACNDGSQLDQYKLAGYNTFGIDPAENLYNLSSKNHKVVCDYLNHTSIANFGQMFDIITAQNVFAHNSYPLEFLKISSSYLKDNGRLFIQTSQADMVINNEFDTIYHEHLSFFSVKSFATLCKRAGLKLIDVIKTPIHGTSFVFVVGKDGEDNSEQLIKNELELTKDILEYYAYRAKQIVTDLKNTIQTYKLQGYTVVGYGAAAKGNTLLNFGKIDLDYIVDDNPLKQNLRTPGMQTLILPPTSLTNEIKLLVVPLAWNFFTEIKHKVQDYTSAIDIDLKFIKYFPEIKVL